MPPYHRLLQLNFGASYNDIGGLFDGALPAEYVNFTHDTLVEGARSTLAPTRRAVSGSRLVRHPEGRSAPGFLCPEPRGARPAQAPQLTVPWGSLDSGLVFERDTTSFGAGSTQTLEPRLFYVYVPYRNQDSIPIFDTALADFNYPQLFTENRFVGGDRFGDASQLTAALTSRILNVNGQEMLRATVGQRYYFDAEQVAFTPTSPLRASTNSDVLASIGRAIMPALDARLPPPSTTPTPSAASYMHRGTADTETPVLETPPYGSSAMFSSRSIFRRSGRYDPAGTAGRYNYSIQDKRSGRLGGHRVQRRLLGAPGGCLRVQAAANVVNTAFVFQLEFNSIGAISTDEAVDILRRNVPGYSVSNPADSQLRAFRRAYVTSFEQVY